MEFWMVVYHWHGKRMYDYEPRVYWDQNEAEKHIAIFNQEKKLDNFAIVAVLYHAIGIEV